MGTHPSGVCAQTAGFQGWMGAVLQGKSVCPECSIWQPAHGFYTEKCAAC